MGAAALATACRAQRQRQHCHRSLVVKLLSQGDGVLTPQAMCHDTLRYLHSCASWASTSAAQPPLAAAGPFSTAAVTSAAAEATAAAAEGEGVVRPHGCVTGHTSALYHATSSPFAPLSPSPVAVRTKGQNGNSGSSNSSSSSSSSGRFNSNNSSGSRRGELLRETSRCRAPSRTMPSFPLKHSPVGRHQLVPLLPRTAAAAAVAAITPASVAATAAVVEHTSAGEVAALLDRVVPWWRRKSRNNIISIETTGSSSSSLSGSSSGSGSIGGSRNFSAIQTTPLLLQAREQSALHTFSRPTAPFSSSTFSPPSTTLAQKDPGSSSSSSSSSREKHQVVAAAEEDVFDSITDRIPERPVTVAEGASYSVVILLGLAVAAAAAYFVVKELLLEPKEYKVFNKALERVQHDDQVVALLGSPVKGYGQESRNRAARQRISHKIWTDEDGVEHTLVQFHIRGPGGTGIVHCEMFKDLEQAGKLQFTYLLVDIATPVPRRIMLESYVPT